MIFSLAVLLLFILSIIHKDLIYSSSLNSVNHFINVIFPALFFTFMMFDLIILSQIPQKLSVLTRPIFNKLFKFKHDKSSYLLIMSLIVPQPSSSKLVNDAFNNNELDLKEANHLLKFNSFFSIMTLMTITNLLFNDITLKIIFIVTHYIANILVGIIFSRFYKNNSNSLFINEEKNTSLIEGISKSITKNMNVLLWVLGFIVMFDVIINLILHYIPLSYSFELLFLLIFDQSKGIDSLLTSLLYDDLIIKALLFFIPLLSIATFIEIKMLFKEVNMLSFILFRIIASTISVILFFLVYIVII